jgi:hypothetical protein
VEFVAGQFFTTAQYQAIAADGGLSVAEAQLSSLGFEGQDVCHRLPSPDRILQGFTQQQQATAFGYQGQASCHGGR